MHLMEWHKCQRWNDNRFNCPYEGADDHEDQPDEEEDIQPGKPIPSQSRGFRIPDYRSPAIPLLRGVRQLKQEQVPEPLREPIPFPRTPEAEPGQVAATTTSTPEGVGKQWIKRYQQYLNLQQPALAMTQTSRALANSRAPATSSARSPVPVRSTSSAARTAAASETALTKSLPIFVPPPKAHDIGALSSAPATATATSSTTRPARAKGGTSYKALIVGAATAVIGAGAAYLTATSGGGRGRGGSTGRSAAYQVSPQGLRLAN